VDRTWKAVERTRLRPERRSSPRARARIGVSYEDAEQHVFLYTADLAEGGAFLLSPSPPPVGASATLVLELPGNPVILRLRGSVVRQQTHPVSGFAVRFDPSAEGGWQALRSFVESTLSGPVTPQR
jgi:hypothetical protein